jgi:triosephosphate isomerase (TIM)
MFTDTAEANRLTRAILNGLVDVTQVSVVVCSPFPYLALVGAILKGSSVALGAQNLYPEKDGALTGEVSGVMLKDLGCKCVILGHSERRRLFGETDVFINQKVRFALASGLEVILCVGETLAEREAGETEAILGHQLTHGLAGLRIETLPNLSLAYEPVWAIGIHGHRATPEQARGAHATIRRHFGQMFGETSAQSLTIQYGGSVKPENAAILLSQDGVDGVLVGGASLIAEQFLAIIHSVIGQSHAERESA